MSTPKISVCIPTYNYGHYLREAVASVLDQSFADFEILIIDDNSADTTREICADLAAQDPRIIFSVNPRNVGMVANWNLSLERARGKYVKFLFGDDKLASSRALERMVEILDNEPEISLVSSARSIIDEASRVLTVWSKFRDGVRLPGPKVMSRCLYAAKNLIGEPSVVMFRKNQSARGFNPAYRQLVDLEMWFHLLEQGNFAYIDEPLSSFRVHDQQQSLINCYRNATFDDFYLLLSDYLARPCFRGRNFLRLFARYDLDYRTWKAWKIDGIMSREDACAKIATSRRLSMFFILFPFHKAVKPFIRLGLKLDRNFK